MLPPVLDATLAGTIQHRFFRKHGNIKTEIFWSLFRRFFIPKFEQLIDDGVEKGWYDIGDPIEMYANLNPGLTARSVS